MTITEKPCEQFAVEVSIDYVKQQKHWGCYSFSKWSKWMVVGAFFQTKSRKSNGLSDSIWEIKGFNKAGQVVCLCRRGTREGQTHYIYLWDMPKYQPAKDYTPSDFSRSCYSCGYYVFGHDACMALHNIPLLGQQTNCIDWEAR